MIFRLSQKVATKIKVKPTQSLPLAENRYADWSTHLFMVDRTQHVLLTNTASLYSTLILGRGITGEESFISRAFKAIEDYMIADGQEFLFRQFVATSISDVCFSKSLDRSITGSMNDMIQCSKYLLTDGRSLLEVTDQLNDTPMSAIGEGAAYGYPRTVFKNLAVSGPSSGDEL